MSVLILIERDESFKINTLKAGVRRGLIELRELLYRTESGLVGEQLVDQLWHDFQLQDAYYVLHNYCVDQHQMDTVFLCSRFMLILEIKNIAGRIWFEEEKAQFLRMREDGIIDSFRNPIDQVKRHVRFMTNVVAGRLPVLYAVVFSNPRTIIGHVPKGEVVFKVSGLESFIRNAMKRYAVKVNDLEQLAQWLVSKHQIRPQAIQIDRARIMHGVICSSCTKIMTFQHGKFVCSNCQRNGLEDFYIGLADYRYLISEWISNQELREFFYVPSEDAARRLLKNLKFEFEGTFKDRKYRICLEKLKSRVNR